VQDPRDESVQPSHGVQDWSWSGGHEAVQPSHGVQDWRLSEGHELAQSSHGVQDWRGSGGHDDGKRGEFSGHGVAERSKKSGISGKSWGCCNVLTYRHERERTEKILAE
jgi:hypothetical protein